MQADEAGRRLLPRQVARHRAVQLLQGLLRRQRGAQARAEQQRGAHGRQQGELAKGTRLGNNDRRLARRSQPCVELGDSRCVSVDVDVQQNNLLEAWLAMTARRRD